MKVIIGTGLVVIGGALALCTALGGFVAGVAAMMWSNDQKEKDALAKSRMRYRGMSDAGERAPMEHPARGTNLPLSRKEEIDESTPESPITLTLRDIQAMDLAHIRYHISTGRFKLDERAMA